MKPFAVCAFGVLFVMLAAQAARAVEASQCHANGGTYLTGRVTNGPSFVHGHLLRNVELSHTRLTLLADQDGQSYDVRIDDVFAAGYDAAGDNVPAPLSTIRPGNRLELCGKTYPGDAGPGIHWVHTNCGAVPSPDKPNGWAKVVGVDGTPGPNLESSKEYCPLWP